MNTAIRGLQQILSGAAPDEVKRQDFLFQPNGTLPDQVVVYIDKCRGLYKPTVLSKVKMDPYVGVYLQSKRDWRVCTPPVTFGGANPTINKEIRFSYIYGKKGTVVRGEVLVTLSLRGGTPFNPHWPVRPRRLAPQHTHGSPVYGDPMMDPMMPERCPYCYC